MGQVRSKGHGVTTGFHPQSGSDSGISVLLVETSNFVRCLLFSRIVRSRVTGLAMDGSFPGWGMELVWDGPVSTRPCVSCNCCTSRCSRSSHL